MHFQQCAEILRDADGLLITAGAGMGVDSGLPDFRGNTGFWRAYPALGAAGIRFNEIATPAAFAARPRLAWGFYGHRLALYRNTVPHAGFGILKDLAAMMPHGAFVFTSNVDGQFQRSGFKPRQVAEVHGSIHHLQCQHGCMSEIWPADDFQPTVNEARCELQSDFPTCPHCGEVSRPNILMFGDWNWLDFRYQIQDAALKAWLGKVKRLAVIEIGAGNDIPTVRHFSQGAGGPLIRINPTDADLGTTRGVPIRMGGLAGLQGIWDAL